MQPGEQAGTWPSTVMSFWVVPQGVFFGMGEMRGVGVQHLHGQGFLVARIRSEGGVPVWSGPSCVQIVSLRAGVGLGASASATANTNRAACVMHARVYGVVDEANALITHQHAQRPASADQPSAPGWKPLAPVAPTCSLLCACKGPPAVTQAHQRSDRLR